MNDTIRFAIMRFVGSIFPVLELAGVISLTGDQVAVIMLALGYGVDLVALFLKTGQQASGTTSAVTASVTTGPTDPGKP